VAAGNEELHHYTRRSCCQYRNGERHNSTEDITAIFWYIINLDQVNSHCLLLLWNYFSLTSTQ